MKSVFSLIKIKPPDAKTLYNVAKDSSLKMIDGLILIGKIVISNAINAAVLLKSNFEYWICTFKNRLFIFIKYFQNKKRNVRLIEFELINAEKQTEQSCIPIIIIDKEQSTQNRNRDEESPDSIQEKDQSIKITNSDQKNDSSENFQEVQEQNNQANSLINQQKDEQQEVQNLEQQKIYDKDDHNDEINQISSQNQIISEILSEMNCVQKEKESQQDNKEPTFNENKNDEILPENNQDPKNEEDQEIDNSKQQDNNNENHNFPQIQQQENIEIENNELKEALKMTEQIFEKSYQAREVPYNLRNFVGAPQNFKELVKYYFGGQRGSYKEAINQMQQEVTGFRRIRGDGNCFYTAFTYQYFTILLKDAERRKQFLSEIEHLTVTISYKDISIENNELIVQEFRRQFSELTDEEQLYERMSNYNLNFYGLSIMVMRNYIIQIYNSQKHLVEMGGQQYIIKNIQTWEEECNSNEIIISALATHLKLNVIVHFIDKKNESYDRKSYGEAEQPKILLLLSPGHYQVGLQ